MALDLQSHFSFLWNRISQRTFAHEVTCEICLIERTVYACGLDWRFPIHIEHMQYPHRLDLGWGARSIHGQAGGHWSHLFVGFGGSIATMTWERYGAPTAFFCLQLFNSYSALAAYTGAVLQSLLVRHSYFPQLSVSPRMLIDSLDVLRALLYPILS